MARYLLNGSVWLGALCSVVACSGNPEGQDMAAAAVTGADGGVDEPANREAASNADSNDTSNASNDEMPADTTADDPMDEPDPTADEPAPGETPETSADETSAADEMPADETPADEMLVDETPAEEMPPPDEPIRCAMGYTGADCTECADGYVEGPTGACVPPCVLVDCGHGTCEMDEAAATMCTCDEGYEGDACDVCSAGYRSVRTADGSACALATPPTTDMVVWLDADHDDSFEYGTSGEVWRWHSRAGADTVFSDGGVSSTRPSRITQVRGGRHWVRFDGVDDRMRRIVDMTSGSYSIFMVARAASSAIPQTLMDAVDPDTGDHGLRLQLDNGGQDLIFRHQMPFAGAYDQVNIDGFDLTSNGIVEARRNPSVFKVQSLFDHDGAGENVISAQPDFGKEVLLQIGALQNNVGKYALEGDVAEVLIFSPAVGETADREAIRDYLTAKWKL